MEKALPAAPSDPAEATHTELPEARDGHHQGGVVAVGHKLLRRGEAMKLSIVTHNINGGSAVDRPGKQQSPWSGGSGWGPGAGGSGLGPGVVDPLKSGQSRGPLDLESTPSGEHVILAREADNGTVGIAHIGVRERADRWRARHVA